MSANDRPPGGDHIPFAEHSLDVDLQVREDRLVSRDRLLETAQGRLLAGPRGILPRFGGVANGYPNASAVPQGRIFELFKNLRAAFYDQATDFLQAVASPWVHSATALLVARKIADRRKV